MILEPMTGSVAICEVDDLMCVVLSKKKKKKSLMVPLNVRYYSQGVTLAKVIIAKFNSTSYFA
jgi:hypothetical protein